jgi:hypothetical protein
MTDQTAPGFDEWCLIELMGRRQVAARAREVTLAGAGMWRLDEPPVDGRPGRTQFVSPAAVYAMHPTTQAIVQAMAAQWRQDPVSRWELPALSSGPDPSRDPAGYDAWAEEGQAIATDPDPDYGRDLDGEDLDDEEGDDGV